MRITKTGVIQRLSSSFTKASLILGLLIGLIAPAFMASAVVQAASAPTYRYTHTFDSNSGASFSNGIATDSAGNVYTTGSWNGTVVFDGAGGSDSKTSANYSVYLTKRNANGSYAWTKTFDTHAASSSAFAAGIAIDGSGNIYVTGQWNGTVVFDGPGGSNSATTAGYQNTFLTKYSADGAYAWTKTFSQTSGSVALATGVAVDGSGNIFIAGEWHGSVTFDGIGGSDTKTSTNGNGFLTKYNADGSYAYTRILDTSASGAAANNLGVAVDGGGNIYITGAGNGTIVFDGPGGSHSQATGSGTAYIIKYSPAGSFDYATYTLNGVGGGVWATGIAVDKLGHVYVSGEWNGTVMFNGPASSDSQTSSNEDAFLLSINADGSYNYTKILDTSGGSANGFNVATDVANNVYLTGVWAGAVTFDGAGGSDTKSIPTNPGNLSFFITQFNASGNYQWTQIIDGASASSDNNQSNGLATDNFGNLYTSSDFSNGSVIFDTAANSDVQTSSSTSGTAFLTSFANAFTPPSTAATTISSTPAAKISSPDTGFGSPNHISAPLLFASSITLITGVLLFAPRLLKRTS